MLNNVAICFSCGLFKKKYHPSCFLRMTKNCSPLKTNKLLTFDLVDFSGIRSCKFYPAANECHGQSCSGSLFDPSN